MKRVRQFADKGLREEFLKRVSSGKPYYNNVRDRLEDEVEKLGTEFQKSPQIDSFIASAYNKQLQEFYAPYELEKKIFLESDEPQYKKDRVHEFVKRPTDKFQMERKDLAKSEAEDATNKIQKTLYPSEWAKQRLSLIKSDDPDHQFWNKILSNIGEAEDKEYEEDLQDLAEYLKEDFGEETSSVAQEVKSARSSSKQNFETKINQIRQEIEPVRKQITEIAQENIKQGGSRKVWEAKIAQAEYMARTDARLLEAFQEALPKTLERKINIRTFEALNVDKNFVDSYRNHATLHNQKEQELVKAREEAKFAYREWTKKLDKEQFQPLKEAMQKYNEYATWWNSRVDEMTPDEFYHSHPQIWAWVEWRFAHYRLDWEKSDAQYAEDLKDDYSYWPLPRNP